METFLGIILLSIPVILFIARIVLTIKIANQVSNIITGAGDVFLQRETNLHYHDRSDMYFDYVKAQWIRK